MRSVEDTLREVPFLRVLPPEILAEVASRCREEILLKGEPLFVEGDEAKGLLVVRAGAVKIFKVGDGGREQIVEIEGPGRSVAELPLFDGLPYPASCSALEDAVVLRVPRRDFDELLARHPALTRAVIASLAARLRRMVGLVRELSLVDVRGRLLDFLQEEAAGRESFELPMSHQEIASRIGTVREIVTRMFSRLAKEGVLRVEGRRVTLLETEPSER